MKSTEIIESYLNKTLVKKAITGGASTEDLSLVNDILKLRLEKNSTFNNRLIIAFIVILFLTFVLVCFLIYRFLDDKVTVAALLGGQGLSIALILQTLHRLYKDKVFTDQLLYALPKMTSENEKIKYMEILSGFLK
jgi:hypothetical protein